MLHMIMPEILASRGVVPATICGIIVLVTHTSSGRFVFINAGEFNNLSYWAKRPLLVDFRPVVCVTTSAANEGRFAMTKKDGKPCGRCGTSEWYGNGNCKQCHRENSRRWVVENPEKVRENYRQWAAKNPERKREHNRRWMAENPERSRESSRQWRVGNPERETARTHRRRTRKTEAGGSYTAAEWKALCRQYGGRCACCGKKAKLTADHVIPVIARGSSDISNIQPLCQPCNSSKGTKATDYRTRPGLLRWVQKGLIGD